MTLALDPGLNGGDVLLGRGQQLFALAGALGGEIGIAADHQPLAGEVGGGDARHVALIEQRELQGAAVQQVLDRQSTQRGDPVQTCRFNVLGDACLGDHAVVADQHHVAEAKALLELVDLRRQRCRIAGVAVEDFDGNRTAVRGAEQAVDDLERALLAVTAVSPFGQRTAASLHVARRDVVEHQRAVLKVASGQRGLDGGLARQQPVERGIEFVVVNRAETERFAKAGGRRGRRERPGGGEFGDGVEDAADQQGEDEVAAAVAVRAEDAVKADLARRAEGGGDVAVGQAAGDGDGVVLGGDDGAALEHTTQAFDVSRGPVGEVAEGAFADLALVAVALAQEDGGRRVPVRDGFDIHAANGSRSGRAVQLTSALLHGYVFRRFRAVFPGLAPIYSKDKSEARANGHQPDLIRQQRLSQDIGRPGRRPWADAYG